MGFLFKYFSFAITLNTWSYMTAPPPFFFTSVGRFLPLFPYVASRGHPKSSPAVPCDVFLASSCPLCDRMDCGPPGSSVHGILQARILQWGCHFLLQQIFFTQGLNPGLRQCRQIFVAGLKLAIFVLLPTPLEWG